MALNRRDCILANSDAGKRFRSEIKAFSRSDGMAFPVRGRDTNEDVNLTDFPFLGLNKNFLKILQSSKCDERAFPETANIELVTRVKPLKPCAFRCPPRLA